MGLVMKIGYIPNEIAIKNRDNDQQNHWVKRGTLFSDTPIYIYIDYCIVSHFTAGTTHA